MQGREQPVLELGLAVGSLPCAAAVCASRQHNALLVGPHEHPQTDSGHLTGLPLFHTNTECCRPITLRRQKQQERIVRVKALLASQCVGTIAGQDAPMPSSPYDE